MDLLVSDAKGHEGVLPLLQFALERNWDGMGEGKAPADKLREIGGVGGALADEAQRIYSTLSDADQDVIRRAFLALVHLGEGVRDTRRHALLEEIVAQGEEETHVLGVLRLFAHRGKRLVTLSSTPDGVTTAEVTHEALLDHWNELRDWIEKSREDIRFHRRLAAVVRNWDEQGRPDGSLWRTPDLDLLRDFHSRAGGYLTRLQVDFFKASDRKEKVSRWFKQAIAAGLVGLTLLAGGAAYYATQQQQKAIAQSEIAEQERVAADSARKEALRTQSLFLADLSRQETTAGNATKGILLGLKALPRNMTAPNRPYVSQAEAALYYATLYHREFAILRGHESAVYHAALSPDGARIVTASADDTARLWDATSGAELAVLRGHESYVWHAAFSPDGGHIVTASWDNTARLWDGQSGAELAVLRGHEDIVGRAVFSPDGGRIVTTSADNTARLWDATSGAELMVLRGHESVVYHAAFSPDGGAHRDRVW